MTDRRSIILALGAATSATALVIGGIMTANALTVDDTLGQVTATAGVGTESTLDEVTADPTPTAAASAVPAPADPVVSPAQPVTPAVPVDVSDDATAKEQHRDARWDDGDPDNDSWWCDDAGSWHWGDHPSDPALATPPTTSDPSTGSGTDRPSSGDSGSWNGGSGDDYSGDGHGGGSWGGDGGGRP